MQAVIILKYLLHGSFAQLDNYLHEFNAAWKMNDLHFERAKTPFEFRMACVDVGQSRISEITLIS